MKVNADILGDKIKNAENAAESILSTQPLIVRLDGNSFSKFTIDQNFKKPFDPLFQAAMVSATKAVMAYCPDAKFGYTQSDEITLVLYTPNPLATPFLANRAQKIASLLASVCTNGFNSYLLEKTGRFPNAAFDCRVFSYKLEEINEPFIWRQQDCFKNCVSSLLYWNLIKEQKLSGRAASKKMDELSTKERIQMLEAELRIKISETDSSYTRGLGVYKVTVEKPLGELPEEIKKYNEGKAFVIRKEFKVDNDLPQFKDNQDFIKELLR